MLDYDAEMIACDAEVLRWLIVVLRWVTEGRLTIMLR